MSARKAREAAGVHAGRDARGRNAGLAAVTTANEVRLVGRVSRQPEERVLPSGDSVWTFRVVVPREGAAAGTRQSVDALDCAVWAGRLRRSVPSWCVDDLVEVTGAVRRRFFRGGGAGVQSRVEVEVTGGRVIRRAASG